MLPPSHVLQEPAVLALYTHLRKKRHDRQVPVQAMTPSEDPAECLRNMRATAELLVQVGGAQASCCRCGRWPSCEACACVGLPLPRTGCAA